MDQITKGLALTAISARAKDHVEAAFHKTYQFPALDCIQVIYKGTVKGNPARCLLAQLYTDFGDSTFLTAKADIVPKDFLYDLSLSMLGSRPLLRDHEKVLQEHKTPETDKMRLKDELRAARASLIDATKRPSSPPSLFGTTPPPPSSFTFDARPSKGATNSLFARPFGSPSSGNFP